MALPGVQVLFAFLLTVPFTQGWSTVTAFQQDLYFASLLASAVASAFLIAPSAVHRLDFDRGDKPRIVRLSNSLAIAGLGFLLLAMVGVIWLITDVLYGGKTVISFTVGAAAVFMVLWFVVPLGMRLKGGK